MKAISSPALGLAFSVSAAAYAGVLMSPIKPVHLGPSSLIEVNLSCREWVSICLKRFGTTSQRYGQCLRNHGC